MIRPHACIVVLYTQIRYESGYGWTLIWVKIESCHPIHITDSNRGDYLGRGGTSIVSLYRCQEIGNQTIWISNWIVSTKVIRWVEHLWQINGLDIIAGHVACSIDRSNPNVVQYDEFSIAQDLDGIKCIVVTSVIPLTSTSSYIQILIIWIRYRIIFKIIVRTRLEYPYSILWCIRDCVAGNELVIGIIELDTGLIKGVGYQIIVTATVQSEIIVIGCENVVLEGVVIWRINLYRRVIVGLEGVVVDARIPWLYCQNHNICWIVLHRIQIDYILMWWL